MHHFPFCSFYPLLTFELSLALLLIACLFGLAISLSSPACVYYMYREHPLCGDVQRVVSSVACLCERHD
jgi:hypothetical protein